jgi:trehalose-6-phosphatase
MSDLRGQWPEVSRKIRLAESLLVILDYEGALLGLDEAGSQTSFPAFSRSVLETLSKLEGLTLAILGNGLISDLRARIGIQGIWYVAGGGLDVLDPEGKETRFYGPEDVRIMRQLCGEIASQTDHITGVQVQGAGAIVALNYRDVDPDRVPGVLDAFRSAVLQFLPQVMIAYAPWAIEARIRCACDERTAIRLIRREAKPRTANLYFGNNPRVQDVLQDLRSSSVIVAVGIASINSPGYGLPDPASVLELLTRLTGEWNGRRSASAPGAPEENSRRES